MLSSVLKSPRAIAVNIQIMRTFVQLRQLLNSNKELAQQFAQLEMRLNKKLADHDYSPIVRPNHCVDTHDETSMTESKVAPAISGGIRKENDRPACCEPSHEVREIDLVVVLT